MEDEESEWWISSLYVLRILKCTIEIILAAEKDWDVWSPWTEDGTGQWVRNRKCKKHDGKCKGKSTQRKKVVTKSEEDDTVWSLERVPGKTFLCFERRLFHFRSHIVVYHKCLVKLSFIKM